jgi:23S rRNA (cytosine1962-C5)-methyltransferase
MINTHIFCPPGWIDYELLDSGNRMKLERWGEYVISRPDPRTIWDKSLPESKWLQADAVFVQKEDLGEWKFNRQPPTCWEISYGPIKFSLKPTAFKHVGVFPEQAVNWEWIRQMLNAKVKNVRILNLFAYTGGTTMAAASVPGAGTVQITHVDSSKPAMMWASENAKLSGIPKENIRWIQDDAMKFVQREIRRGAKYDGIIMDPPKFGRGTGGEIWKLEENLPELVKACKQLLADTPLLFLINAYTADLSHLALQHLLSDVMKTSVESGELGIKESASGKILPAGIFARWNAS